MKTLLLALLLAGSLPAQDTFQVKVTGRGQPMILIPGLSSSGEVWDATVARYKDRYECHVLTVAGFAGVPRVPGPMLERVRDAIATYIRDKKLAKPVVVGHSLGGYWALALGSRYPSLVGKLVIVDAYPFLAAIADPSMTAETARTHAGKVRAHMMSSRQEDYERDVRSGTYTRQMVSKEADLARVIAWGLASDRTAVADAMAEMYAADLREDLARIQSPTLVLGAWIGYRQYTDRARTEANLERQYTKLAGVEVRVTDTANHFIMWDDPEWMFSELDRFLAAAKPSGRS